MTAFKKSGQSFLALVVLIGAIVAVVGVLVAFLANSLVDTGYGLAAAAKADSIANSGVQDALLKFDRNGNSWNPGSYTVSVGSGTAIVSVTQSSTAGYATIQSSATVSGRTRKVSVVVAENMVSGQVSVVSWQEVQ